MRLLDQYAKFRDYIAANTPRSTRPVAKPGDVLREGLLDPNKFNAVAANRFKDSVFGLLGGVPGVGDAASAVEAADLLNRGEKFGAGLAALGALPLVPAIGMIKTPAGRYPENYADTKNLAEMLVRAGNKKGYHVAHEGSSVSPSQYVTFARLDDAGNTIADSERQVRISNHYDRNPGRSPTYGKRFDVAEEGGMGDTFEHAVQWLEKEGYKTALSTRYKNVPSWEELWAMERAIQALPKKQVVEFVGPQPWRQTYKGLAIKRDKDVFRVAGKDGREAKIPLNSLPADIAGNMANTGELYKYLSEVSGLLK